MTEQRVVASRTSKHISAIGWLLLAVAALHGLMLVYDYFHPSVFLNADRAMARWQTIEDLYQAWDTDRLAAFLAGHGIAGDYLFQGLLLAWFGRYGLILVQVGLALWAGFAVYRMSLLLGMTTVWATLASGVYLLLPHTLVFPHQLASEALYSPLVTISLWLTLAAITRQEQQGRWGGGLGAGLAGIATLIRPVTLLWPLVPLFILLLMKRRRSAIGYAIAAFLPIVLWASFMAWHSGHFGFGPSDHDMAHNLYQRTARVIATLPPVEQVEAKARYLTMGARGTLPLGSYLSFGLRYPAPFLLHSARDSLVFFAKSGLERIPIDYLLINPEARAALQDADSGWRKRLESEGMGAALGYLWRTQGVVLLLSLVGSALLLAMMGLVQYGARHMLKARSAPEQHAAVLLLLALPLYVFVFSQVVDAMQSRHRAPAEAALVLLAVAGAARLAQRYSLGNAAAMQRLEAA